jgi:hypothetical protein
MFAIANTIELRSVKLGSKGEAEKSGFVLNASEIKEIISEEGEENTSYHPIAIDKREITIERGTKIVLKDLKKGISKLETHLRKRLARRFSVIGKERNFIVLVNGREISIEDRDYFQKMQYIWIIGEDGDKFLRLAKNVKRDKKISGDIDSEKGYKINGWIGTLDEQKSIEEGNNTIVILAWGKLIHEDILKDIKEPGVYSKYLIGEIQADFLDDDNQDDIVTSARQSLKEDDPRFEKLKNFIQTKILKEIQHVWTDWRKKDSTESAIENPKIKEWYESLGPDKKKYAEQLFQKIDTFPIQDKAFKKEIYKFGILAFEKLRLKDNLSKIKRLTSIDELKFAAIFNDLDDIEATMYHDIATERLGIIETFKDIVDANEKEKVLQKYIFDHLWLLHPSWERATYGGRIEESVTKEFDAITAKLSDEEKKGRIDIRYRTAAGKHIIIELKRADRVVKVKDLYEQLRKYRSALETCLETHSRTKEPVEVISILGKPYKLEYKGEDKMLDIIDARVIYYDQLIEESIQSYSDYIEKQSELTRLKEIIDNI